MNEGLLSRQIRNLTLFVIIAITLSGITAFPLESELNFLNAHSEAWPVFLAEWIKRVYNGLKITNESFPFISYGTDWLGFAHLIITMLFIGVMRNPVKNSWIVEWAIFCCIFCFPLAFIAGSIRQIPVFHRLIDCSFGAIGLIPLLLIRKKIRTLELIILEKN